MLYSQRGFQQLHHFLGPLSADHRAADTVLDPSLQDVVFISPDLEAHWKSYIMTEEFAQRGIFSIEKFPKVHEVGIAMLDIRDLFHHLSTSLRTEDIVKTRQFCTGS